MLSLVLQVDAVAWCYKSSTGQLISHPYYSTCSQAEGFTSAMTCYMVLVGSSCYDYNPVSATPAPTPAPTPPPPVCSAQTNCDTSTLVCLASPNEAFKACTGPAAGYYIDGSNGLVAQCTTQMGCSTHNASAACVGTNADEQRCTAASSGYKVVSHLSQPDCDFAITGAKAIWKAKCCGMPVTTPTGPVSGYPGLSNCGDVNEKINSVECGCSS